MAQILDFRFYRATRLLNETLVQMENVQEDVTTMAENFDALHSQVEITHGYLTDFQDDLQEIQDECQRSMDFSRRCQQVLDQADMDEMVRLRDRCLKKFCSS